MRDYLAGARIAWALDKLDLSFLVAYVAVVTAATVILHGAWLVPVVCGVVSATSVAAQIYNRTRNLREAREFLAWYEKRIDAD